MLDLALQFLLLSLVSAQTTGEARQSVSNAFSGQSVVSGIILIIVGLMLLFAGYRLLRPTLFIAGMAIFTVLGYILLTRLEPAGGYQNHETVLLLGSLAIGLIGGFLAFFLFSVGLSLLGALGGGSLAMFLLSWRSQGLITSETGRAIFIAVFAVLGAIAMHFLQKPAVIVASSFGGSYLLFTGIDVFTKTGFNAALRLFLSGDLALDVSGFTADGPLYGLLVGVLVVALVGMAVQYSQNRGRKQ